MSYYNILGELLPKDEVKFAFITEEILEKIKKFKEKFNLNIIWRGLVYEWVN
jgi:hypothetical protein